MRARRSPQPARRAGFTFIELLVVIAVISLLSAIVVVNLDKVSVRGRLSSSARMFGNQILALKDLAALQQREMKLEIDVANNRWRIVDVPSPNEVPDPKDREDLTYLGTWQEPDAGAVLAELAFSRTDRDTWGTTEIAFDADGELSPSGFVAFFRHDELREEEGVSVEVSGLTGLVSYHQGRIEVEQVREPDDF